MFSVDTASLNTNVEIKVKVKLSLCLTKHHAIDTYGAVKA